VRVEDLPHGVRREDGAIVIESEHHSSHLLHQVARFDADAITLSYG
jgi:hypothetical protein